MDDEDSEGEQIYSSTLSSTSAVDGGGSLYRQERPGTHTIRGSVGPRAGAENLVPHRDSTPGP